MSDPQPVQPIPPPLAFTQGVGTVFQFTGVMLFLVMSAVCCTSSLLGKDTAERPDLDKIGWRLPGDPAGQPFYSVPRALSTTLMIGVGLGAAVAGIGLGLQATRRSAIIAAVIITPLAALFWFVHVVYAIQIVHAYLFALIAAALGILFTALTGLAFSAMRDMRRNPPPRNHEVLPPGYKIPYSWYHDDPPEVRLARELDERKRKLAIQQKEIEMLEEKIRRKE